jgi:hypothetical protein
MLENPGSIPRPLFHFLTSLTQKQELLCSFFNEVATETLKTNLKLFHFLTRLTIRKN